MCLVLTSNHRPFCPLPRTPRPSPTLQEKSLIKVSVTINKKILCRFYLWVDINCPKLMILTFNNDNAMLWGWYHLPSWVWPFPRFDSCSILIANHDNQLLSVVQIMILHLIASSSDYFYPMDLQTDLSFPNRAAPDHNEWFRFFHCWERLPAKDSQGSREIVVYYIKRLKKL